MARSIWSGVISFGLVSIPVRLYSATKEHEVAFHQFEKGTKDRIRYKRVNERTDDEVSFSEIVKGAEVGDGYVMLDADDLESVAPGRSRSLEISTFVDLDEIDPIYFQKTYWLGPDSKETAKTYALLREAMEATNKVAIASFVMRGKEYLAAIRADGKVLALETMFFADEIRDPKKEVPDLPTAATKAPAKELAMAKQLVTAMSGPWKPTAFHDTYTDRVKKMIKAKEKGREVVVTDEAPTETNVVDLMEALNRSVEASKAKKKPAKATKAKKAS